MSVNLYVFKLFRWTLWWIEIFYWCENQWKCNGWNREYNDCLYTFRFFDFFLNPIAILFCQNFRKKKVWIANIEKVPQQLSHQSKFVSMWCMFWAISQRPFVKKKIKQNFIQTNIYIFIIKSLNKTINAEFI